MKFCLTRSQSKSKEFEPEGAIKLRNSRHDGLINKCPLISIYLPLCKKMQETTNASRRFDIKLFQKPTDSDP